MPRKRDGDDEYEFIFVTSFFHRGLNRRITAAECGKRAFRLKVRKRRPARSRAWNRKPKPRKR